MRRTSSQLVPTALRKAGAALAGRSWTSPPRIAAALGAAAWVLAALVTAPAPGETGAADPFAQATPASPNPFRTAAAADASRAAAADPKSARTASDQALLDARRALSVGDLARAQQFLGQAQQLGVAYEAGSDSPQRLAESVAQGLELAQLRKSTRGGEQWRVAYSKFLVAQADALVSWTDYDTATRAANEAAQLNPNFAVTGLNPKSVLKKIDEARKGAPTNIDGAAASAPTSIAEAKGKTLELLAQAREALAAGNLAIAEQLAGQASALNVPETQFAPTEDRPSRLATDLVRARGEAGTTTLAVASLPATATPSADDYAHAALDALASSELPPMQIAQLPPATPLPAPVGSDDPVALLEAGEQALRAGDRAGAFEAFRAAYANRAQLDVLSQQKLQGHLQLLSADAGHAEPLATPAGDLLNDAAAGQTVAARQLSAEVGKRQSEAERLRQVDPTAAVRVLREARTLVEESTLEDAGKRQLISRLDMTLAATEKYILDHKSELELDAANREILQQIERERQLKANLQTRMAAMVEQFNTLLDEHRYSEAEVVANRLYEMAPDELVSQQVNKMAKTIRRNQWNKDIIARTETGVADTFLNIRDDASRALAAQGKDITYAENWDDITSGRGPITGGRKRGFKELEIEQKLKTQVLPKYEGTPLAEVVKQLSQLAGVNIHLDPRGLEQEGYTSDALITFAPLQEISLRSALTLILEPLNLTYTIKDEVLKITSKQIADGDVFIKTYPVGDLVIPIPNFVPTNNMGLQGLINEAYAAMGGAGVGLGGPIAMVNGTRPGQLAGPLDDKRVMAQLMNNNAMGGGAGGLPLSSGPGGLGGAANADFDSLIDLIVSTVEHESWMENGTGEGEIQPFPTNLSLVISQTQRVHEQIADLLEQLRRLQDLQVTIEVRFIRLTDSFFERIGVDFDFNIEDGTGISTNPNVPGALTPGAAFEPRRSSASVGIQQATGLADFPNYTVDLDMPFRQGSFGLTVPQFGTPSADAGATFGFAVLSDIEAFFLIEAAQGDRRSNVLQAPKVTLFNGQQATVVDATSVPFVISVVPVVGDFAAAQMPVIVVLNEGTMMSVQAVVSDDRRYVRLTLVPSFNQIGEVRTFTFEGTESSRTVTASTDDDQNGKNEQSGDEREITRSGTTVQLPQFAQITVATTVSVPDGGTVLLGGIKRLREGRNEFGVPLLSKIPYVDRLFRNVSIGRETDSLMMMVTPHIIIQEEEEQRLGVPIE